MGEQQTITMNENAEQCSDVGVDNAGDDYGPRR